MSFELFVAICLIGCWALLPLSMALAVKQYEDALYDDGHGHNDAHGDHAKSKDHIGHEDHKDHKNHH